MRLISGILGFVIACGFFVSTGNAAIVLTFSPPPTFVENSGIQPIDVFANSTLLAGESRSTLGADFSLGGGAVFNSPNAGIFGGVGFIGNGNIILVASTFGREPQQNLGVLNINFGFVDGMDLVPNAQLITNTPSLLATLLVNTNGLTPGNYTISVTNGFFGGGIIADTSSSFNITTVPEPSGILTLGICMAGGFCYRQRRARKVVVA